MRLVTVGCSGSFAGPDSPASNYLVQVPAISSPDGREWNVVLDLGSGSLGALQRACNPRQIDAVGISHLHPDHFVDLAGLYVYLRYHPDYLRYHPDGPRPDAIPVWGPAGIAERLAAVYGLAPGETLGAHLDMRELAARDPFQVGPLTIEPYRVRHPVEAYGFRVTGPSTLDPGRCAVLAYTGDTDACAAVTELGRDADLLLSEAAFHEGRDDHVDAGVHLTGLRAGVLATAAGARRLVLTHLPPWNDPDRARAEAARAYGGPLDVATAGAEFLL